MLVTKLQFVPSVRTDSPCSTVVTAAADLPLSFAAVVRLTDTCSPQHMHDASEHSLAQQHSSFNGEFVHLGIHDEDLFMHNIVPFRIFPLLLCLVLGCLSKEKYKTFFL